MKTLRQNQFKNQRGSALVLFVLFLFVLFGVLSLVVDLGFTRLTQMQMQAATDSGSIVGLREVGNQSIPIEDQRFNTSRHVRTLFDDNSVGETVDLASDPIGFGAGPNVVFGTGGSGLENEIDPNQIETDPVYKPVLETNVDNFQHGDMVRGNFGVPGNCNPGLMGREDSEYCRDDFTPSPTGNDFLVRMRRTDGSSDLDNETGVSASGGVLPFLFARGSSAAGSLAQGGGVTVRATSIAKSNPVFRVGVASDSILGVSSFAIEESAWNNFVIPEGDESAQLEFVVETDGAMQEDGATEIAGGFISATHDTTTGVVIGQEVVFLAPDAATLISFVSGVYVPIYSDIAGRNVVIGFGRASMEFVSGDYPNEPAVVLVTKFPGGNAHQNASGVLIGIPADVTPEELNQVLALNDNMNEKISTAVLAR